MKKKYVILSSGKKLEITGEKGKYYICKNQMFRKANPTIKVIEAEDKSEEKMEKKKAKEIEEKSEIKEEKE